VQPRNDRNAGPQAWFVNGDADLGNHTNVVGYAFYGLPHDLHRRRNGNDADLPFLLPACAPNQLSLSQAAWHSSGAALPAACS
jgi:hypothetical protein